MSQTAAQPIISPAGHPALSERDQLVLEVEQHWYRYGATKDEAIRTQLRMSATDYHQVLGALMDSEAALAHNPVLVQRLRRLRASRQLKRTARRVELR